MDKEIWKPIEGFNDYMASNMGRIKSLKFHNSRILKSRDNGIGYLQVGLSVDNKSYYKFVHGLVAAAFLGEPAKGMECNHKDGNKKNNHIDNIEYVTHSENLRHAFKCGLLKNSQAKLTWVEVNEIRKKLNLGISQTDIAFEYGVTQPAISHIATNRRWKKETEDVSRSENNL